MNAKCMKYAKELLEQYECKESAYKGVDLEKIESELKEDFPEGMPFPYGDVAKSLREIGDAVPDPQKKPFMMLWSNDSCADGVEYETLEEAKNGAFGCLESWMEVAELEYPQDDEQWNNMLETCSVSVVQLNEETGEHDIEIWELSDDDAKEIGWIER